MSYDFVRTVTTADNPDPNEENNEGVTAGSTPPPPTADLSLQKLGPSVATANSDVTYTITLTNGGPNDAVNATLDDTLPGTMTFVSESHPVGFNCTSPAAGAGGTISCAAQVPLPPGNYTFTIVGHIPAATPNGTTYDNTVTAKADNDPNPDNNQGVVETTVDATNASVVKTGPATATASRGTSTGAPRPPRARPSTRRSTKRWIRRRSPLLTMC